MSIGQIVVLAVIVGAFVVFAAVLGWGDYRNQQLRGHRIGDRPSALAAAAVRAIAARRLKSR